MISLLAALAMMTVWFTLSARSGEVLSWLALLAAADIALLERWTRAPNQPTPRWIAPTLTLGCCLASLWLIIALNVSFATGLSLRESAKGMGYGLFRYLLAIRLQPLDWIFLAVSPVLAFVLANTGINGRHPPP